MNKKSIAKKMTKPFFDECMKDMGGNRGDPHNLGKPVKMGKARIVKSSEHSKAYNKAEKKSWMDDLQKYETN
jgi:hypothetical protein